jgi:hypothetical protein
VVVDWQAALIGHEAEYNEAADGIHQTELGRRSWPIWSAPGSTSARPASARPS